MVFVAQTADWNETAELSAQTRSYFLAGLKKLWKLLQTQRKRLGIAVLVLFLVKVMELSVPLLFKEIVDELQYTVKQGRITDRIMLLIWFMFAIETVHIVLNRLVKEMNFLRALIELEHYWPNLAHQKLLALPVGYHERENTGRKIAKVSKGVERLVGMVMDIFWQLLPSLLYLLINVCIIFVLDWRLGLCLVIPLVPFTIINIYTYQRFYPEWLRWEKKKEESVGLFCQSIINVRSVQTFVREKAEQHKHQAIRSEMGHIDIGIHQKLQRYFMAMELVLRIFFLFTVFMGIRYAQAGSVTVGEVVYVFYTGNATLGGLWGIINVYTRMLRHLVSAERMQMLLEEPIDVANDAEGHIPDIATGVLRYEHVTHTYLDKEEPAINDFNLAITPGEMFALVGRSGSGKSTLADILTRVFDPTAGRVTIDGHDIRAVDRDWYRKWFAVVPQDVEIFEGTIRYNITLARPDAPSAWVAEAVTAACLSGIANDRARFPDGLETGVGERGVRLSGGERQRVGIARAYIALLAGAQVLVLDEATASLDSESESVIQGFIEELRAKRQVTIVAIAHRLSTIRKADRICVLEEGRTVELGDHARLLEKNGLYSRLVELQNIHEIRE